MFKDNVGATRPPPQSSAPQNTATRSGAKPNASKVAIETSAPAEPHTQGRYSGGNWLK